MWPSMRPSTTRSCLPETWPRTVVLLPMKQGSSLAIKSSSAQAHGGSYRCRSQVSIIMGTLKGFPCPPALWLQRAKPASAYANIGTGKGFAPALRLQRAKPASAYANIGTGKGFALPRSGSSGLSPLPPTRTSEPEKGSPSRDGSQRAKLCSDGLAQAHVLQHAHDLLEVGPGLALAALIAQQNAGW
jgi:hypothetical protein